MKTISANSTGADFIKDINDNFDECVTGGGSGDFPVNAILQGGDLKSSTGYADGKWCSNTPLAAGDAVPTFVYTDDNYNKYLHTGCYLSLAGNKVKGVTVPNGSTLSIFCYDDNFTLLSANGVVNTYADIPSTAKYVKFQLYNASGYASVPMLAMVLSSRPKWVKNSFTPLAYQFYNYEVKPPKLWDANYTTVHSLPVDSSADVDNMRYHDNCFVMLPPNYSPDGEPCKLVIFFSGDATTAFMGHNPFVGKSGTSIIQSIYETNYKYFNNHGYAVVCFGGYTSMWSGEKGATIPGYWAPRLSPAYVASLRGLYDFLMRNYNFDPAPYLAAKSAGGNMLLNTAATLPFPVRAAAGFSIGISLADLMTQCLLSAQKSWQKICGCANWNSFVLNSVENYSLVSDGQRASKKTGATANQIADADRLIANIDIYKQLDAFTIMSDIDYESYMNAILQYDPFNDAEPPQALKDVIAAAHKNMRVPLKLWCATKDPSVPYAWHKLYADWVKKCNGICELRSYTGDDGNHATFCGGVYGGGKVTNASTPYGGTMSDVNIGFVEAVEWFKKW